MIQKRFFRLPGGEVAARTLDVEGAFEVRLPGPPGAVEISADEYERELTAYQREREAWQSAQRAEAERLRREDYEALRALGLAEGPARRMSGWRGSAQGGG